MADNTHIEWTEATWNPITGCELVDEGCRNCYAARLAAARLKHHPSRAGLARLNAAGVAKFTGEVRFNERWLTQPLRWKRPRKIFVIAHGDIAHRNVPDHWIDRVFAVMALAPQHTFQVLTKRPERLKNYLKLMPIEKLRWNRLGDALAPFLGIEAYMAGERLWPLPNVIIGTSINDQESADNRLEHLQEISRMGWKTFVSYEPATGPVDWAGWEFANWIISGGESGDGARPSHPDWHRDTRDFCARQGISYLFKQWGEFHPWGEQMADGRINLISFGKKPSHFYQGGNLIMSRVGKSRAGRLIDGKEYNEMPEVNS